MIVLQRHSLHYTKYLFNHLKSPKNILLIHFLSFFLTGLFRGSHRDIMGHCAGDDLDRPQTFRLHPRRTPRHLHRQCHRRLHEEGHHFRGEGHRQTPAALPRAFCRHAHDVGHLQGRGADVHVPLPQHTLRAGRRAGPRGEGRQVVVAGYLRRVREHRAAVLGHHLGQCRGLPARHIQHH